VTTDQTVERGMPDSIQSERAILGAILLDNTLYDQAAELLTPDDFSLDAHRRIYSRMQDLQESGRPVDAVTLPEELNRHKELEAVGGSAYLSSLIDGLPERPSILHYVAIVRDKAISRSVINLSQEAISETIEQADDSGAVLEKLQTRLFELSEKRVTQGFCDMPSVAKAVGSLDDLYKRGRAVTGLETHYSMLDEMTGGFQPADLIIIAARPSMGKTSLAMNIAENAAVRDEKTVGIFSLEMSKEALYMRMLASSAQVDSSKLRTGFLTKEDMYNLQKTMEKIVGSQIFIDDSPGLSISEMRAKARRLKNRLNGKLDLVIVDYLQLMGGGFGKRAENRTQEVSAISRGLKALAKELACPLVALSQLSRAPDTRGGDHRPQLSDLRESGSIEQDADVVAFIFREEVYKKDDPDLQGKAELILAKQRNGPTGTINLAFLNRCTRFENLEG
jgi:replicative DNA helicase